MASRSKGKEGTEKEDYKPGLLSSLFGAGDASKSQEASSPGGKKKSQQADDKGLKALSGLLNQQDPLVVRKARQEDKDIEEVDLSKLSGAERRIAAKKLAKGVLKENPKSKAKSQKKQQEATPKEKDPAELERTLFVGGVPVNAKPKKVRHALGLKEEQVEAVYFRSVPVAPQWRHDKKAGVARKEYDKRAAQTKNAYIVLKKKDPEVIKACLKQSVTIDDLPVRVNLERASGDSFSKFDRKRSVFVGKLAGDVTEAELWKAAEVVGQVEGVRIVRDPKTKFSKGFGFVLFSDRAHVAKAIQLLDGKEIQGKAIAVTRAMKEDDAKEQREHMAKKAAAKKQANSKHHRDMQQKLAKRAMKAEKRGANKVLKGEKKKKGLMTAFSKL
uniref:RRM domain-containing protein n=1 Tax=Chromera velia CCMP2878 TaxID=1169474 RepID=A0A0G4F0F4_9ALVE|mmetsp:Transcript_22859/g.45027  ORF Transcript_22859/g.45027 Transcript_22859/m.45027 type:complete len:386 (+) Transcript_22859:142-1299(+)|eukprot:Cvel_14401.t1-p1 / transcript=Cvel_14401.t1 / gene=Cvel_14401 / organism=Chromera_velia_CCMP2878 / gene_product=RNA-binding protein 34, putative / transcript_product=RNA-binding protein 34, putative / location=Cvel_scaffold1023:4521-9211(-) / protein_length=385 / sequence_SO=supercontig / SO=protein_coding / is_pseudo=false